MSSFNYEKALSLDWNGQLFVLTIRGETPLAYNYLYSYDGTIWTTSKDLSNSTVLVNKNPYNVKWTGTNYTMMGNLSTSSGNTLLRSSDGIKYSALTTTNLTSPIYDLETNLEFPHTITFPRNMTLALGGAPADTTKIAYSLDEGITWTPSSNSAAVFSSTANNAVWNGKLWVAVGSGGNTIATSTDANTWVGRGSYIFTTAGYGVAWSREQTQWVACGTGTNSLAYSPDGVYWTPVSNSLTSILSTAFDVRWNGTIWLATGIPITGNKSIAYSYDGRSWSLPTQTNLFDVSGIKLSWNGNMWTAIGRSTAADASSNIATSIDGINWKMFYNSNLYSPSLTNIYTDPQIKKTLIIQNAYPPLPPTGLTVSSAGNSTITFTFTASSGAISYTATAIPTSGNTVVQTGITSSPVTLSGLQTKMSYTITMVAINTVGSSQSSSSLTYSTIAIPLNNISPSISQNSYSSSGTNYIYYSFATSGTSNTSYTATIDSYYTSFDYVIVAGGGGGGISVGSGGGGGGVLSGTMNGVSGTINITVGGGGLGMQNTTATPVNGNNSVFTIVSTSTTVTALGGGGGSGQSYAYPSGKNPPTGGSGGGQTRFGSIGYGTNGQGNNGGTYASDNSTYYNAGGGGGAGQVGQNATSSGPGRGGNGIASSITGTSVYYGGGGGASGELYNITYSNVTAGGLGGGGSGDISYPSAQSNNKIGSDGTDGLGGGGGGSGLVSSAVGHQGGSGVVIIRFVV